VFVAAIALSVAGTVAAIAIGLLGLVFSLANLALVVGAIVLAIRSGLRAGEGHVARYPARLSVLK
jgi:uncharacterized Tic20 family protein